MSRIWIYQADRRLTAAEVSEMDQVLSKFVASWKAHGASLNASYEIKYQLFVILKVDETLQEATGCSIDESVHLMKELEKHFGISLFNRQRVAYEDGDLVKDCSMAEFKTLVASSALNENTMVYNNTISKLEDFETKWRVPAKNSWHKMLLN